MRGEERSDGLHDDEGHVTERDEDRAQDVADARRGAFGRSSR